jgi:hypothetical protein
MPLPELMQIHKEAERISGEREEAAKRAKNG